MKIERLFCNKLAWHGGLCHVGCGMTFREFYSQNYSRLTGYGLWLRGEELNRMDVAAAPSAELRVMFARLSTYADTVDSATHPLLYAIAAGVKGVYADLAFLPPPKDALLMDAARVPWLLGTQSKYGPEDFDVIGFSNSIVQELVNLPAMLAKSRIPWSKTERLARPELPLLILGGANAAFTTVLHNAPAELTLVDGVFNGEDPELIARLLVTCREAKKSRAGKLEVLRELENLPGFFQPDQPQPTRKTFWKLDEYLSRLPQTPLLYAESLQGKWPLSEGCPAFCSFCAESWVRKPYRETSRAGLRQHALACKAAVGLEGLELQSFNFNMHSELYGVLWDAVEWFKKLSLKSQRFDWLAKTPELPAVLQLLGKSSLTCGLEGISPRLRRFLRKNLDEDSLWRGLESLAGNRLRELKIFLIATGRETEPDFHAYSDFLGRLRVLMQRAGNPPRVILSVTPLARFPWTPLEFEPAPTMETLETILKRIEQLTRPHGFEVRRAAEPAEYCFSQILLRAARPEILSALLEVQRKTGFVYYREVPRSFLVAFLAALTARGIDPKSLLEGYDLAASRAKPWAIHETGVRREFLWEQYQKALLGEEDPYCLGHHGKTGVCLACGACPDQVSRVKLTQAKQARPFSLKAFEERLLTLKKSVITLSFAVWAGAPAVGAPRSLLGGKLVSALMRVEPALAPFYRGCVTSQLAPKLDYCWVGGCDALTLEWRAPGRDIIQAMARQPDFIKRVSSWMSPWGEFHGLVAEIPAIDSFQFDSPFPFQIDAWLKQHGLKCTTRRIAEDRMACEFTRVSLKKKIVVALEIVESGGDRRKSWQVIVQPGLKFEPEAFARAAFRLPEPEDWVRIGMLARYKKPGA
jgi:hypothetical protein